MRPVTHVIAVILGIAGPVAFTLWSMTDYGPRSRAHYEHAAAMDTRATAVIGRFTKLAIDERQPAAAVEQYFAPNVVEHGLAPDGAKGADRLVQRGWGSVDAQRKILNVVAETDRAVVQQLIMPGEGPPHSEVDIFRVEGGKIVEHWEVGAPPAPAEPAE
jgi:predicted SnoaL-like aldol condensation-catalyzing enzyme